jgi:DNA-binding NtrC family response regulator
LVVATNENLAQMVRQGRFREDLYMRLNPATRVTLPGLRERSDDFQALLQYFLRRVCATGYNRDLLLRYADGTGLTLDAAPGGVNIRMGPQLPARGDQHNVHLLLHPSSYNLLREFPWPGNFRQLEMTLANLVTFTLVELVDRVAQMDPGDDFASRPDVVPIQPRTVRELVRPWQDDDPDPAGPTEGMRVTIALGKAESLNAASCEVERQYLAWLFRAVSGDLGRMAEVLLGDSGAGRKIQLRMNQLGMRLRELKRGAQS